MDALYRRKPYVAQVEKNPKDLSFLNVMLTIFHRLGSLDLVSYAASHPYLHLAAFYGWSDITEALLVLGGNPDVQDSKGSTALHAACASLEEDSTKAVQVLIENGADPNIQVDASGFTPMHHLIGASCNAAEPWDCIGKIEALLSGGADINALDKRDRTPIHLASCIPWCNSVFDHLCKRGASLDLSDDEGRSILHYAALYGDLEHITYLRKRRLTEPDPDGKDINYETPLDLLLWRANEKEDELWKNMKQPTGEEVKAFRSLIDEIRIHRWQDGHDTSYENDRRCRRQVKYPKTTDLLKPPPSIEQDMGVEEQWAYYVGSNGPRASIASTLE
ncbi:hypothetical protein F52700_3568 [Fusarium sp. NRRL 52700]|nr:hypothetical protein F52700_3568 [Fusarium sp. NRRL 52700]